MIQELFKQAVNLHLQGRVEDAITIYNKVLRIRPDHHLARNNLGALYLGLNDNERALNQFKGALKIKNAFPDALNNLATALKNQKRYEEALEALKQAISLKPDFGSAYFNLGNTYREMGNCEEAISAFNRAASLKPDDPEVQNSLGSTLLLSGQLREAKEALHRALNAKSDYAPAFYNLGLILMEEGGGEEAIRAFLSATEILPGFSDAYLNLGNLMERQGRVKEAINYFKKALETNPCSANAYYNVGLAYEREGNLDRALQTQESALEACPDSVQTWVGGARAFMKIADWKRADPFLEKLLEHNFNDAENGLLSDALIMFHAIPLQDETDLAKKHFLWGDYAFEQIERLLPDKDFDLNPNRFLNRKIRIGYVSPDFCRHSVGWFIGQIISSHDGDQFEVYCYATGTREDDLTEEIEERATAFRKAHHLNTRALARKIYEDRIHILVDLAGHTRDSRLDVFAVRPAPIQVTVLGYPNGTGLKTVDYRITDHHAETPTSRGHYREKLVSLSRCFMPLGPLEASEGELTRSDLRLPDDAVVLVSFNRSDKLRPEVLGLWDRVLAECEEAVLAVGCGYIDRGDLRSNILSHFSSDSNKSRVFFLERAPSEETHRARYQLADLALDTFPYSGTTTSYEALRMGVPVLTLVGERHAQRTTYSMLKHLGMNETIAYSEKEYLKIATNLIKNPRQLKEIRRDLMKGFENIEIVSPKAYTLELEEAYCIMWARFQKDEEPTGISF